MSAGHVHLTASRKLIPGNQSGTLPRPPEQITEVSFSTVCIVHVHQQHNADQWSMRQSEPAKGVSVQEKYSVI